MGKIAIIWVPAEWLQEVKDEGRGTGYYHLKNSSIGFAMESILWVHE